VTSSSSSAAEERLLYKALMYVFGKRRQHIVNVHTGTDCYFVKCEYEKEPGTYYIVEYPFAGLNGIDEEIQDALRQLRWIAEGNEFPQ
jgi:hypothetical protein